MPPGADKSPVNRTGMLGPRISTVALDEDVLWAVSSRTVWSDVGLKMVKTARPVKDFGTRQNQTDDVSLLFV